MVRVPWRWVRGWWVVVGVWFNGDVAVSARRRRVMHAEQAQVQSLSDELARAREEVHTRARAAVADRAVNPLPPPRRARDR